MYDDYPEYESDNAFDYDESEDREFCAEDLVEFGDWKIITETPLIEDQYYNHFITY